MNEMVKVLEKEGFSKNQIDEILKGKECGIDVAVYAKKEFMAIQMQQIRLGLIQGLQVEKYAKPEYDWFQMEEIRKGLEAGIDISKYAFPEISYDRMQQIRLGLEDNMDLYDYRNLDAGVLKQLRLALKKSVQIVPYIVSRYDAEQLEAIREALEKGIDVKPWVRKEYRGIALREIFIGLQNGLDVSAYADIRYNWQQMREIRLGIEHMVDIERYKSVFYSGKQMMEIRLGLEDGLDVSYYCSPMYTASEMHKRRIFLEENPTVLLEEKIEKTDGAGSLKLDADIEKYYTVTISEDETEAYIEVHGSPDKYNRIDIVKLLQEKGITYGIKYDVIDNLLSQNRLLKPLLIATGKKMMDGKDGWYEYFFRTEIAHIPKQLEDGNVDYRDVEWIETVEKGQKIAFYHDAELGEDGITITGKILPAKRGREKNILTGKGFKRLADGKTYVALLHGIVTLQGYQLNVSELLVVNEVNMATGNIEYDGNVLVEGNVSSGARIKATKDIVVKGFVETAQIVSGGNVFLQNGMNGSGSGSIRAAGDVIGYFFEGAEIYAGGNIQGDYFFNSSLYSQGQVKAVGKKGTIAGGNVCAESGLVANNLGNMAGLNTYIRLGSIERIREKEKKLNELIDSVNQELYVFQNAHRELERKFSPEIRNTMDIYLKIESAIYTKEKQLERIFYDKKQLEDEVDRSVAVNAIVKGKLYEGVTFEIDGIRWKSKGIHSVILKKAGNRIAIFSKD